MRMPGWYDIPNFNGLTDQHGDEAGLIRSQKHFHSLIQKEMSEKSIPSDRIVIGGFSQGGAMSLFSGITSTVKLAGIFGLSCYLPMHQKAKSLIPEGSPNHATPIFLGHGDVDPLVKLEAGQMTSSYLKSLGFHLDFRTYP